MKLINILIAAGIMLMSGMSVSAQEFLYTAVESMLTEEQSGEIQDAQSYAEKAEQSNGKADAVEEKYDALLNSKKSKKRKKFEKKGWEAKKYRIDAEVKYSRAYTTAVTVYSDFLNSADFYDEADKTDALALNSDAVDLLGNADNKLSSLKKSANDKKALQKKLKYKKVLSETQAIHQLFEDALNRQFEALEIYMKQADKKKYDENDKQAWAEAQSKNTIEGYEGYLTNFSRGKFVAEARAKIAELKKKEEEPDEVATTYTGYTFKVQIAASRLPLSYANLKRKYTEVDKIERQKVGRYYKYRVGGFNSYGEAAALRDRIKPDAKGAFIVVFDKDNNQVEVTDDMKK